MADSLGAFTLQRRSDAPPAGQAISDNTGWTDIATLPSTARGFQDTDPIPSTGFWYRPKQTTVNGVVLPYPVKYSGPVGSVPGTANVLTNYGGTGNESAPAMVFDRDNNLYMACYFNGTINLGSAGTFTSTGLLDLLIVKATQTGTILWAKHYGGTGNEEATCIALHIDGSNVVQAIYVGGGFTGVGNFGGVNRTSNGDRDGFVAKYDPDGDYLWDLTFGLNLTDTVTEIIVNSSGEAFFVGYVSKDFSSPVSIGGIVIMTGSNMPFVARLNPSNGTCVWVQSANMVQPNTAGKMFYQGLCFAGDGNILIGGYAQPGTANWGGGNRSLQAAGYIVKYDRDGVYVWDKVIQYETAIFEYFTTIWSIACAPDGTIYVGGNFKRAANFGGGVVDSIGSFDLYVARYASDSAFISQSILHASAFNGIGRPSRLRIGNDGSPIMNGYIQNQFTFGNYIVPGNTMALNTGFIVKINPSLSTVLWANGFTPSAYNILFGLDVAPNGLIGTSGFCMGNASFAGKSITTGNGTDIVYALLNP